jgi:hypothetical protein
MKERLVTNEIENMWKETVMAYINIYLKGLRITMKDIRQDT